jgi:oligopeptide transport system substrate-binding protein
MARALFVKWSALFAMATVFFVACDQPEKKPKDTKVALENVGSRQELRINMGSEPRTLDPSKARDLQSITLTKMLFEGLTRLNKGEKIEMALAERVEISEDQKTYTFFLREAKWSNGSTVTAEDFYYAWKRVLDPEVPADNAFQLYAIKNAESIKKGSISIDELGVKVLDEKTLQIELETPTPYFLELTSYPAYFPVNAQVSRDVPHWTEGVETFVGNGPFKLKEWERQDVIKVEKNPLYWDQASVQLDQIALYVLKEDTELTMFENKEIDWAGSPLSVLPLDALGKLNSEKMLNKKPILGTYFLRVNTEDKLLSSAKIRQALSLSVDRAELVEHALSGSQIAASGFVPEALGIRSEGYFGLETSHAAKKLFDEALEELSVTRSEFPEIEILFSNSERSQRIAQLLQARWLSVLGIKVRLSAMESQMYLEKLYKGDFQIAAGSWLADYNDSLSFLEIFKTKTTSANHTHWENGEYERLIEASHTVTDSGERAKIFAQCEKILLDATPVIPLFHYNLLFVKNEKVKDVLISNMGVIDFRWAHIDSLEQGDIR